MIIRTGSFSICFAKLLIQYVAMVFDLIQKILMDMPYLDAVLKEGLRLYPSVPAISRELSEDITLNNYHLAQGTSVMLHIYSIHRDPDVYDEPDRFNPDRWINKEVPVDENPYCYIPFSGKW